MEFLKRRDMRQTYRFIPDALNDKGSALNDPPCHSEHREESRPGKGKRFFAHALPPFEGGLGGGCSSQRPEGVSPHRVQGLKARYISAPSRKGGVSMPAPFLEG